MQCSDTVQQDLGQHYLYAYSGGSADDTSGRGGERQQRYTSHCRRRPQHCPAAGLLPVHVVFDRQREERPGGA